ncbi:hypothetical protein EU545_04845, partial [Candidatus Thorarchaeota archaeon]
RSLYRFVLPLDARSGRPEKVARTLQTIALAVNPLAIGVEGPTLPPRRLQSHAGLLPASPRVQVKSIELLTEPEISTVAKRITEMDIPATNGIWQLLDYDYSLDQVARIMAVGLLGRHGSRRCVPLHGAYKAVIDSFISRAIFELSEEEQDAHTRLHMAGHLDSLLTIVSRPGPPRVDYLQLDESGNRHGTRYSLENPELAPSDAKTALYADHARFAVYTNMLRDRRTSHVTVFHHIRSGKDGILGPWTVRAAVEKAFDAKPLTIGQEEKLEPILNTVLGYGLERWFDGVPVLKRITGEKEEAVTYPLVT